MMEYNIILSFYLQFLPYFLKSEIRVLCSRCTNFSIHAFLLLFRTVYLILYLTTFLCLSLPSSLSLPLSLSLPSSLFTPIYFHRTHLDPDKPGGDTAKFQQLQASYQEILKKKAEAAATEKEMNGGNLRTVDPRSRIDRSRF